MIDCCAETRLAREEDAEEIVEVIRSGFAPIVLSTFIYGCPGIARFIKYQIRTPKGLSDTNYVVASVKGCIVGCIELRYQYREIFLSYISVLPEFRSMGIAKKLLKSSIDFIRKPEHNHMFLDVLENNSVAREWYKKLGFKSLYPMVWLDIPLNERGSFESIRISGYPQAETVHATFGFSQFTLVTLKNHYEVGRIGQKWFRLTQFEALSNPAVMSTLWHLDADRHVLAILPEREITNPCDGGKIFGSVRRMCIDLERLATTL